MLKINFSKQAEKFLRVVHPKHGKQIASKIAALRINPSPSDTKKLTGFDFHRVDVGEYRIIFLVNDAEKTLEIILIGKRNDGEVYKALKNLSTQKGLELLIMHRNRPDLILSKVKLKSLKDLKGTVDVKVIGNINESVLPGYDEW